MQKIWSLFLAAASVAMLQMSTSALADEHAAHHDAVTSSAANPAGRATSAANGARADGALPAQAIQGCARMSQQAMALREMHSKIMNAKTSQQRQALMSEQMQMMHNGMSMMEGWGPGSAAPVSARGSDAQSSMMNGSSGMGMMGAAPGAMPMNGSSPGTMMNGVPCDSQMMSARMDMMQAMMRSMMDQMAARSPAKQK